MKPNIPQAVRHLLEEYRRFLRTPYRFLDPQLRLQFEKRLASIFRSYRGGCSITTGNWVSCPAGRQGPSGNGGSRLSVAR